VLQEAAALYAPPSDIIMSNRVDLPFRARPGATSGDALPL